MIFGQWFGRASILLHLSYGKRSFFFCCVPGKYPGIFLSVILAFSYDPKRTSLLPHPHSFLEYLDPPPHSDPIAPPPLPCFWFFFYFLAACLPLLAVCIQQKTSSPSPTHRRRGPPPFAPLFLLLRKMPTQDSFLLSGVQLRVFPLNRLLVGSDRHFSSSRIPLFPLPLIFRPNVQIYGSDL